MGRFAQVRRALWGAWWRKTLVIVAALVALYAAVGFWAVPALVQWQLPKWVAEYTTARASVGDVAFNPFTFHFRASDFDMTSKDGQPLVRFKVLDVNFEPLRIMDGALAVAWIRLAEPRVNVAVDKAGRLNLAAVIPPNSADKEPEEEHERGNALTLLIDELAVTNGHVAFTDASGPTPVMLDLRPIDVSVTGYSSANDKPIELAADVGLEGGTLHVNGQAMLDPLGVQLKLKLADLPLASFQAYVSRFAHLTIKRGTLGVEGRVSYRAGKTAPDITFEGRAGVHGLAADSGAKRNPFVRLGDLAVEGLRYTSQPASLSVERVVVDKPFARLVVNPDQSTNVSAIFSAGNADKKRSHGHASHATGKQGAPLAVSVGRIRVKHGVLRFTDLSMTPNVSVGIEALTGSVQHVSTRPGRPAEVDLKGYVGPNGVVTIKGTINPLGESLAADIRVQFNNLGLTAFSPYSGKFAGYRIESGKIDLTLDYVIHDGLMQGKNNVVIDQFELGEEVDSPRAMDLPLKLAVALLKDSQGVIKLDLPVEGNLNNPQFAIAPLILKVLGNVLSKAVTSPFHMLASLAGASPGASAGGLDHVTFVAGRATLTASEQQSLSTLATALAKRPSLMLGVRGVAAPSVDRDALARRKLLARIRGTEHGSGDELSEQAQKRLLEYYRATFNADPKAQVKRAAGEDSAAYHARVVQAALKRLVAHTKVPNAALEQLAQARAKAVRHYLVQEAGLGASRIFMLEPQLNAPVKAGAVQMPLKLEANLASSRQERHVETAQAMAAKQAAAAHAELLMERLSKLQPKQMAQGIVLTIGDLLFAFDSAEFSAAANDALDKLASFLRDHPSYRVRIEGYTDSVGSAAYNQRLSERRAQSVADAMMARGIDPDRMKVIGYGESNPVAPNSTGAGRARNRRVELVILGAGEPKVTSEPQANVR
ncbi:MAG: DUF748 domain-containing protein [Nitrococcus sp.]|nr:DUF748 domain-containing protein [Nitrococcus sp.]